MIDQICVTKIINSGDGKVWQAIAGIGGLERWFPVIADCRVEGTEVGAMRVMQLQGGGRIIDRIEVVDHGLQRLCYRRIEHPFPVSRYYGTVDVADAGDGKTKIVWTVEIDVEPEARGEVAAFVKNALSDGIDGLELDLQ